MAAAPKHVTVLLDEAMTALAIRADGKYVDATYGRGGHARTILAQLGPQGRLLAMDRDPQAVVAARAEWSEEARFEIVHRPFSMLGMTISERGWQKQVNGILFDLGVSSPQLDESGRGFSFRHDGPLDMRMDTTRGETAAEWLQRASESEIAEVLQDLGEERYARRIARVIVRERALQPITTTKQFAAIVTAAMPTREHHKDPATRSFQAVRLHVNRELDELRAALDQALEMLASGGRLVAISFHSLEDRIVKQFLRAQEKGPDLPPDLPVRHQDIAARMTTLGKPLRPSEAEVQRNPRARSAMLRVGVCA